MLQTTLPSVRAKSTEVSGTVRTIGKGGMGNVFLFETGNNKFVIKELSPNNDPTSNAFGIDQVLMAETLPMQPNPKGEHKNIIHVRGVMDSQQMRNYFHASNLSNDSLNLTNPSTRYVVLEYMHGTDMADVLEQYNRITVFETAILLYQISSALEKIHEFGIIHRDLKPSNIFRAETDNQLVYKLFDFGVATKTGTNLMCKSGICLGTPEYIAPDQLGGQNITPADIYALGVTAIELITGYLPFKALVSPQKLYAKLSHSPLDQTAKERWPVHPLGMALQPIIQSCVEINPENRPTATQLKEAILYVIKNTR